MKSLASVVFISLTVVSACSSIEHPSDTPPQKQAVKSSQKDTDRQKELDARIDKLVELLGSEKYWEREAATEKLARIGKSALPALMKALKSGDPEVRERAKSTISVIARKSGLTWTIYLSRDGTIREEGFDGPEVPDFKAALKRWSRIAGYRDTEIPGVKRPMLSLAVNLEDKVTFGTLREKVRKPIEEIKISHLCLSSRGSAEHIEVRYVPWGATIHFFAIRLAHNEDGSLRLRSRGRTFKGKEELLEYIREVDNIFDRRNPEDKLGVDIRAADEVYVSEVIEYAKMLRETGFEGLFVLWPGGLSLEKPIILLEEEIEIVEPKKK